MSLQIPNPHKIALIVAVAENGVIGLCGRLPWRMPSDLKTFRRLTMGRPIIMGRKTFQSIGKPLDGRDNIVVTRDTTFTADGVIVVPSLAAAIERAKQLGAVGGVNAIMIIGGAQIYAQASTLADRIYLTRIAASPRGDAHFATPDPAIWKIIEENPIAPDPRDDYPAALIVYERL